MKIVVVDDHPLVRQGILSVLSLQTDMSVVGEASEVKEAIAVVRQTVPDIVMVDLKLGKETGLDVIKQCQEIDGAFKYLVLTSSVDQEDFRQVSELGVEGYVLKEALPEELLSALRLISRGRKYYDPGLVELMMKSNENEPIDQLTQREREVLRTIGDGLNNKDIAKKLFITEYTVKKHVSQILAKLGLADRTQAAIYINHKA